MILAGIDHFGAPIAALIAATACLVAAKRQGGRFRAAWALIGASALAWSGGQAVQTYYEVARGQVPAPSPADAGYLGAVPLAIAGLLLLFADSPHPGPPPKRGRVITTTLLDGAIIASSLLAVSWVTVLEPVYLAGGNSLLLELIRIAHPIGDVGMLTALVLLVGTRAKVLDRISLFLDRKSVV